MLKTWITKRLMLVEREVFSGTRRGAKEIVTDTGAGVCSGDRIGLIKVTAAPVKRKARKP